MSVPKTEIILRHAGAELARVALPPGEYTIGRQPGLEIYADTPLLSRHHARLTIDAEHLQLEDLGSSNGTYIGDRPVTRPTRFLPSEAVRLGDVQLEIRGHKSADKVPLHAVPPPVAPSPEKPSAPTPPSRKKNKRFPFGTVVAGVIAIGIVTFLVWPDEQRLTQAEIYARMHPTTPAPAKPEPTPVAPPPLSTPPPQKSSKPIPAQIEDLRRALVDARVQGLKADAITVSPSGKIAANLSGSTISDLSILESFAVDDLRLTGTHIAYLDALRDLPLVTLHFNGTSVADVQTLAAIPTLENVLLGKSVQNLETLRASPSIQRLSYEATRQGALSLPSQTAEEFWKVYDEQKEVRIPAIAALQKMGVQDVAEQQLTVNKMGRFEINLASQPITNLAPLTALSLARLDIGNTKVSDLTPLRAMSLQALNIRGCPVSDLTPLRGQPITDLVIGVRDPRKPEEGKTKVTDLSPLRGMPLTRISLEGTTNPDVAPLADCPTLRTIVLPQKARNVEALRKLPNLKKISWGWPGSEDKMPAATAFWQDYDTKNGIAPAKLATNKPGAAPTPKKPDASADELAADDKALGDAKQKRLALFAKFQFAEAHAAITDPALKTDEAREQQELLGKKAQWLANFKSQLIEDVNKTGYAAPITRKSGPPLPGGIVQADDLQIKLRSQRGLIPIPWTDVSFDSVLAMGASFILPNMPKEIAAFRKWQLGVFASYAGKKPEALALLQEAAQLKPIYRDELPIFQHPTDPW